MNCYSVKLGLAGELSQQELIDILRNDGIDVIQTSDGVCLKTTKSSTEIKKGNSKIAGLSFDKIDCANAQSSDTYSEDIKKFISA